MSVAAALVSRLKEPSSYAGIGMLLAALGLHVEDATLQAAIAALCGVAGLVAVLLPEQP